MAVFMPYEYFHNPDLYATENIIVFTTSDDLNVNYIFFRIDVAVDRPHVARRASVVSKTRVSENAIRYGVVFEILGHIYSRNDDNEKTGLIRKFTNGMTITINDGSGSYEYSPDYPLAVTEVVSFV